MLMRMAVESFMNRLAEAELRGTGGNRHRIGVPVRCRRARPAASAIAASCIAPRATRQRATDPAWQAPRRDAHRVHGRYRHVPG